MTAVAEDPFKRRLDEINKEMLELLHAGDAAAPASSSSAPASPQYGGGEGVAVSGSPHRHQMSASHFQLGSGGDAAVGRALSVTAQEAMRREVQAAVSREMRGYDDHVRGLVSREWDLRVRELDAVLRARFQELKIANDALSQSITEVAEGFQQKFADLDAQQKHHEKETRRMMADLSREVAVQGRTIQSLRDVVNDVEGQVRADARDVDLRVESIVKRHGELVRATMSSLDEKIQSAQRQFEGASRDAKKQFEVELDDVERVVNRMQGAMDASAGTLERLIEDVQDMGHTIAANQSALRACRSDVNRLDVATRAPLPGGGRPGSASGHPVWHMDPSTGGGYAAPMDVYRMQQDIFALKECVAFLHNAIQAPQGGGFKHNQPPMQGGFMEGGALGHEPRRAAVPQPLAAENLNGSNSRPPYIASARSTPTKARVTTASAHQQQRPSAIATGSQDGGREEAGQWSDGGGSFNQSPTYRTVPDSDSEDERQNSKLARSQLD